MKIDGKKTAQEIIKKLKERSAPKAVFAAVLVGGDSASISFLKKKEETAKELGVDFRIYKFDEKIKNDDLRDKIGKLASSKSIGGIIIQLPLPEHLNKHYVLNAVPREKDVDVLGERALGAFYADRNPILPPAVGVVEEIIKCLPAEALAKEGGLKTKKVAVIGRGLLVGKPASLWLQDRVAELSVFSSQTENMKDKLKDFDVIVSGVGKAGLFSAKDVKENALVIDFGYDFNPSAGGGKISGDFDQVLNSEFLIRNSISYTPTPGGTGPVLVAKLFENFYELNKEAKKKITFFPKFLFPKD
jgi:methylenetetrahydrofolate dehydrogenase (NADP+)/methenyltetrahydrofolate cyclohydrolase